MRRIYLQFKLNPTLVTESCVKEGDGYTCTCLEGWQGAHCDEPVIVTPCEKVGFKAGHVMFLSGLILYYYFLLHHVQLLTKFRKFPLDNVFYLARTLL